MPLSSGDAGLSKLSGSAELLVEAALPGGRAASFALVAHTAPRHDSFSHKRPQSQHTLLRSNTYARLHARLYHAAAKPQHHVITRSAPLPLPVFNNPRCLHASLTAAAATAARGALTTARYWQRPSAGGGGDHGRPPPRGRRVGRVESGEGGHSPPTTGCEVAGDSGGGLRGV